MAALDLVETVLTERFEDGIRKKREAARPPADVADVTVPAINHVSVIGVGTMDTGIAMRPT